MKRSREQLTNAEVLAESMPIEWDLDDEEREQLGQILYNVFYRKNGKAYGALTRHKIIIGNFGLHTRLEEPSEAISIVKSKNQAPNPQNHTRHQIYALFEENAPNINAILGSHCSSDDLAKFSKILLDRIAREVDDKIKYVERLPD